MEAASLYKGSVHFQNQNVWTLPFIYIFWNYSHFCLLSKVNIPVLVNEYLLTLSPTLYCVWTKELRFKGPGNGKVF